MHNMHFFERNRMLVARPQPQSPWILFFDGTTRDNGNPNALAGIGAVLKNSHGHIVVELKKVVNPSVSFGVAKYKALIAGLKKALSLGVGFLLVKGDSRLIHNQVVGHCSVQDDRLVDYQRKVLTLSKDFRALFFERISREDNLRADQLANDAIDEELHVVDSLSEFIDPEWTSQEKRAFQQHSVHPHARPHTHHSSSHPRHPTHLTHPMPLPAPHLKVKPVASVSPHVVKRQAGAATKSEECRRSRLFNSNEEPGEQMCSSGSRSHVQAAAKSRRTLGGRGRCSPRRPAISASSLHLWENSNYLEDFPLSEDSSGDCSRDCDVEGVVTCNLLQAGEGDSASGSGNVHTKAAGESVRVQSGSSSNGEYESDDGFCEEDYSRLLKTLLKGFMDRKKGSR